MKMNVKGNNNFGTPDNLYQQLHRIFNFQLDTACSSYNCKCRSGKMFDKGRDGLKDTWGNYRCFCNPPFSDKAKWIEKAYNEVINGTCPVCVMILPTNCLDSKAWHKFIENKFHYEILQGRVSFIDPETNKPKSGNNSGTVIVYFKRRIER